MVRPRGVSGMGRPRRRGARPARLHSQALRGQGRPPRPALRGASHRRTSSTARTGSPWRWRATSAPRSSWTGSPTSGRSQGGGAWITAYCAATGHAPRRVLTGRQRAQADSSCFSGAQRPCDGHDAAGAFYGRDPRTTPWTPCGRTRTSTAPPTWTSRGPLTRVRPRCGWTSPGSTPSSGGTGSRSATPSDTRAPTALISPVRWSTPSHVRCPGRWPGWSARTGRRSRSRCGARAAVCGP